MLGAKLGVTIPSSVRELLANEPISRALQSGVTAVAEPAERSDQIASQVYVGSKLVRARLDPLSPVITVNVGAMYRLSGRLDEAIATYDKLIAFMNGTVVGHR
ncbi:MAG: hypothetical protein ABSB29_09025 [Nitrososphaerales archaeon]|jgi:hypothetical protein